MDTPVNDAALAAWRSFINAHVSVISRIEERLSEANQLSLTWYDVLVALAESPGCRLRMNDLALKVVVLSRSGVTRVADRLEAEGLLVRERTAIDRRGAYAILTDKGQEALDRARPVYARGIAEYFSDHLDAREIQTLTSSLERVDAIARQR